MKDRVGVAIGVDAGATKTLAVLVDDAGAELQRVRAGGANVRVSGVDRVAEELRTALGPLIEAGPKLRAICIGAAGSGRDVDREMIEAVVRALAPTRVDVTVQHDAYIALAAFTADRPAFVVIAGTGSIVFGENVHREGFRGGGWGAVIGDPGSGYAIGLAAVRHAARVFDGIAPDDMLSSAVCARLGVARQSELVDLVQRWPPDVRRIADLAREVGVASSHDVVSARAIIAAEARALFEIAGIVVQSIRGTTSVVPVALTGGAFIAAPQLATVLTSHLTEAGCSVATPALDPALCAAHLALRRRPIE